jgi:hypothetical protein
MPGKASRGFSIAPFPVAQASNANARDANVPKLIQSEQLFNRIFAFRI